MNVECRIKPHVIVCHGPDLSSIKLPEPPSPWREFLEFVCWWCVVLNALLGGLAGYLISGVFK